MRGGENQKEKMTEGLTRWQDTKSQTDAMENFKDQEVMRSITSKSYQKESSKPYLNDRYKFYLFNMIIDQLMSKSRHWLYMLHFHPILLTYIFIFVDAGPGGKEKKNNQSLF